MSVDEGEEEGEEKEEGEEREEGKEVLRSPGTTKNGSRKRRRVKSDQVLGTRDRREGGGRKRVLIKSLGRDSEGSRERERGIFLFKSLTRNREGGEEREFRRSL